MWQWVAAAAGHLHVLGSRRVVWLAHCRAGSWACLGWEALCTAQLASLRHVLLPSSPCCCCCSPVLPSPSAGKPIASLAFHVSADVMAIACGHKLYIWEYTTVGRAPTIVLKTRRSMRAVHFHPHGLPLVLTAEVQDPSPTPELPPTLTEAGPFIAPQPEPPTPDDVRVTVAAPPAPAPQPDLPLRGHPRGGAAAQLQGDAALRTSPFLVAQPGAATPQADASPSPSREPIDALPQQRSLGLSHPMGQLDLLGDQGGSPQPEQHTAARQRQRQPSQQQRTGVPGWVPPGSSALPASMVPTGWELPFPTSLFTGGAAPGAGTGQGGSGDASWAAAAASLPHVMAAFSAAAWNIIGEEQPPRVRLKLWRWV